MKTVCTTKLSNCVQLCLHCAPMVLYGIVERSRINTTNTIRYGTCSQHNYIPCRWRHFLAPYTYIFQSTTTNDTRCGEQVTQHNLHSRVIRTFDLAKSGSIAARCPHRNPDTFNFHFHFILFFLKPPTKKQR